MAVAGRAWVGTKLEQFNALSVRERLLVAACVLAATWLVWSFTLGDYLYVSKVTVARDVETLKTQLDAEAAEQQRLRAARASDPNAALQLERNRLDKELAKLGGDLHELLARFVPPDKMPALLEDLVDHHQALTLKRIVRLPTQPLVLKNPNEDAEGPKDPNEIEGSVASVFRHPILLEFEGGYFAVLDYLNELENSGWRFNWRRLEYEVVDYPIARVEIEIETLSRDRGWLGV